MGSLANALKALMVAIEESDQTADMHPHFHREEIESVRRDIRKAEEHFIEVLKKKGEEAGKMSNAFWESVENISRQRDQIPADRRALSGVESLTANTRSESCGASIDSGETPDMKEVDEHYIKEIEYWRGVQRDAVSLIQGADKKIDALIGRWGQEIGKLAAEEYERGRVQRWRKWMGL